MPRSCYWNYKFLTCKQHLCQPYYEWDFSKSSDKSDWELTNKEVPEKYLEKTTHMDASRKPKLSLDVIKPRSNALFNPRA